MIKKFLSLFLCLFLFIIPGNAVKASAVQNINFNVLTTGYLTNDSDEVTYAIQIPTAGKITINFNSFIDSVGLQLTDTNGNYIYLDSAVYGNSYSGETAVIAKDLEAGLYYFKVSKNYSNGEFNLKVDYSSANSNDIEPNNDNSTAQSISLNTNPTVGYLTYTDNVDVYKLQLNKDSLIYLDMNSELEKTSFQVTNVSNNVVFYQEMDYGSSYEPAIFSKLVNFKAGTYYIKVSAESSDSGVSTGIYRLGIKDIGAFTGFKKLDDGNWVYIDPSTQKLQVGWLLYNGKYYYFQDNGYMQTSFATIDGRTYYFGEDGDMKTGWVNFYGSYYYFDANGANHTGWLSYNGKWYYIDSDGAMCTGLINTDDGWYCFDNNGNIKTGWVYSNNTWYYFRTGGRAVQGWLYYNGAWYYTDYNGEMVTGLNTIDNNQYYFNNGIMKTGWQWLGSNWYHFDKSGAMMKGWYSEGGHWYYLHSYYGYMVTGKWTIDGNPYNFSQSGIMQ